MFPADMNLERHGRGVCEVQGARWERQQEFLLSEICPPGDHRRAFGLGLSSTRPDRREKPLMGAEGRRGDAQHQPPLH